MFLVNDVIYYYLCPHISKGYLLELEGSDTVIKFLLLSSFRKNHQRLTSTILQKSVS